MANPKLTVLLEKLRGTTFELDKDEMSVGRKASCDICIPDASLSGHHATLIKTEDGGYMLRDNESTNGTRVNNVPITEQVLQNSSIIQFGGVEVLYDDKKGESSVAGAIGGRTHTISLDTLNNGSTTVRGITKQAGQSKEDRKEEKNVVQRYIYIALGALVLMLLASAVIVLIRIF